MDSLLLAFGEFGDALAIVKLYGPFLLAAVFFVWRDYKREDRLSKRINTLEDEQRNIIIPLVKQCSSVIAENTVVMQRLEKNTLYRMKRNYGATIDIYKLISTDTNVRTGKKTVVRDVTRIRRAPVLPGLQKRIVNQSISLISANKQMVMGGTYDMSRRRFIVDRRDAPELPELGTDDWVVYDHRKWQIESVEEFEVHAGWVITGRELVGEVPDEILQLSADHLLVLGSTASGDNDIPVIVEHLHERSAAFMQADDRVEIRITGPVTEELSKGYHRLLVDVNVLLTSRYGGIQKNGYQIITNAGLFHTALSQSIPVWNYGDESGDYQEGDPESQIFLGCLQPARAVKVYHFGQNDKTDKLKQTIVDGLSGTAALTDSPPMMSDSDLDLDDIVLNTDITTKVPIGARFTVAGETGTPVHVVTGRTNSMDTTTNIEFSPPLGAGTYMENDVITFLPNQLDIKVGDGDITYTEADEYLYDLDRDELDTVRKGQDQPMEVSLNFVYEQITTGTDEPIAPMDAIKRRGGAAEWVSAAEDKCEPYAIDVVVVHTPPCGTTESETTTFPDFRSESREVSFRDANIAISGRCNATEPIVERDEFDNLCPAPKAPVKTTKNGAEPDTEDDNYKKSMEVHNRKWLSYLVIKTLEPSDIEWDTVDLGEPSTWVKWQDELKANNFCQAECNRILQFCLEVNSLDEAKLDKARESFLQGLVKAPRINLTKYRKQLQTELGEALAEATFRWLSETADKIPVYSGASKATFIPLANEISLQLAIAPIVRSRIPLGLAHGDGEIITDPVSGRFTFTYYTDLFYLVYNEYHNANLVGFHLRNPGPYRFQEAGRKAFEEFSETVRLPNPFKQMVLNTITVR
ncbi:unnamed protein product [Cladocopium goreaui]|uniref:DUF4382 domain-containing protein n=1 Tax=Cladocopium goreaui TaxID=2562237 RepID=A0A9P1BF05_9DINO|nr:unnamed protein product [Cladocopium goreaui]